MLNDSTRLSFNTPIKTTCAYCGVGCGIQATVTDAKNHKVTVEGDSQHPANYGRLCSKGSALGDTVSLEGRLLHPHIDGIQSDWDMALDNVTSRLKDTLERFGPDAVALYGSGQLLTEDYYVANKLMKGFVGSANIDTNSRLCMASTVAGQKRAFGTDTVPGCYEDLELADLVILTGSNTAWCHPVVYQRIQAAKQNRPEMKIVVIDPRRTATCELADLHLPIDIGTDTLLFSGLLVWLAASDQLDKAYIGSHTTGFEQTLLQAQSEASDIQQVATGCGLSIESVQQFYQWFGQTENTVTAWSQGVNQARQGTDKVNAIINCHLATGRIGKPGCGPFSLTGQPNAMGGREVGGLANQLAAHMDFNCTDDVNRVARFWKAANIAQKPGLTAVDLFDAVHEGKIKFIWIMGTNPVVSMPNADKVREALKRCPHVIVSDCIRDTDTTRVADVCLPACGWSEKDGTVTNSERRISRQRALFPASGEAKPDWWIISQIGKRLGFNGVFDYQHSVDIFREHAALSAFENHIPNTNYPTARLRDFNIGGLAELNHREYDELDPVQWPVKESLMDSGRMISSRMFSDGQFYTESGKASFVVPEQLVRITSDDEYPLVLNTGRIRDQWHTMTRTGLAPRLNQHINEPVITVHPDDAMKTGVVDNELACVESSHGKAILRTFVSSDVEPGACFAPMHWTGVVSSSGRIGAVVHPETDPFSRQPDSKASQVRLKPFHVEWHAVLITRKRQILPDTDYSVEVRSAHCFRYEMGHGKPGIPDSWLPLSEGGAEFSFDDPAEGYRRRMFLDNAGHLFAMLLVSPAPVDADRHWLEQCFGKLNLPKGDMWRLLAAEPPAGESAGPVVCACFGVGEQTICRAIGNEGLNTPEALGEALNAGTNCGSCIPELRRLIKQAS